MRPLPHRSAARDRRHCRSGEPEGVIELTRTRLLLATIACALLVAHLLFLPYAFTPLTASEAAWRFARIRWDRLGSDQNVALVSRALMFLPLGALLAASAAPAPRRRLEWPAWILACLLGAAWALGVNFAQLWFPGRTVNLNNVAAEFAGVAIGALLWSGFGRAGLRWWSRLASGGRVSVRAALDGYVIAYLLASLMPFDFVTSSAELAQKIGSDLYGLWRAPVGCGPAPCWLRSVAMVLATLPCGWWLALRRRPARTGWLAAGLVGVMAAAAIEGLHFLMVSGVSQGASVAMRALGMGLGAFAHDRRARLAAVDPNRFGRPAVLALLVPYLAAIVYVVGWFRAPWLGVDGALARLDEVRWMPFFHQYFAPYTATMASTLLHLALYAPVGLLCWLWAHRRAQASLGLAAALAAVLAFGAETSKVFLAGRVADYTDVLIAAVAAAAALVVLRWASSPPEERKAVPEFRGPFGGRAGRQPDPGGAREHVPGVPAAAPARGDAAVLRGEAAAARGFGGWAISLFGRAAGLALIALAFATALDFPVGRWALLLGLGGYAVLLWRVPTAYLVVVPLLLPLLDLAPASGRFYWDEFDALLALTLGLRLLMPMPARHGKATGPWIALALLAASVAVSTPVGLLPLDALDGNAFTSYLSRFNALRVGKGYAWALGLVGLVACDACTDRGAGALGTGLALGLAAAVAGVLWERLVFVGFADLAAPFRAAGFVSATHVGGAYLEAILVVLAPFALAQALRARSLAPRLAWSAVVVLGAAAVLTTLSRAAFAAWLVALAVYGIVWVMRSRRGAAAAPARQRWGAGVALALLVGVTLWGALSGPMRQRLGAARGDFELRLAHWRDALDAMTMDVPHLAFGMGLGSFPRAFYTAFGAAEQLAAYRLVRDPGTGLDALELLGGRGLYVDQRVGARRDAQLRFTGLVRSPQGVSLEAGLCEKSLLNSTRCEWSEVRATPQWRPFELRLQAPTTPAGALAPVSLSLHQRAFGTRVDVARLALFDGQRDILANGSFAQGLDRWFTTSDVHLAWRVLNTPLQVVFEQGLFGLAAWFALFVAVLRRSLAAGSSPAGAAALWAMTAGLGVVAAFDSLLDSPRISLLVVLALATVVRCEQPSAGARDGRLDPAGRSGDRPRRSGRADGRRGLSAGMSAP